MKRVYFIKPVGMDGPIKIGCSEQVEKRLSHLTRKRRPLEIAATIPGDYFVERQFHTLFREDHIGKEWFFWTAEMGEVIAAINAGTFDLTSLPAEPVRLPRKLIEYTPERRARMSAAATNMHRQHALYAASRRALAESVKASPDTPKAA